MALEPTAPNFHEYEVRCHDCGTSFARGTRRCVHCGQRLGRRKREFPELAGFTGETETEDEAEVEPSPGRALVWVATAILALAGTLIRLCGG